MAVLDLHTHSNASDGTLSPAELVTTAAERGVDWIGLTDHDTIAGLASALAAAERSPVTVVPGVELSSVHDDRDLHVLGYFIDADAPVLTDELRWLREMRLERILEMAEKTRALGYPVDEERLRLDAESGSVGRPHIARQMIEFGYVTTIGEAFARFLGRGKPAFVEVVKLTPAEAIELVRNAGGVPVMAHPFSAGEDVERVIRDLDLLGHGLGGLETYYGEYSRPQRDALRRIADSFGLIPTGGSDYHGDGFREGRVLGSVDVPDDTVDRLLAAR